MKIAIPTAEGRLAMHFGHCNSFRIIETDESGAVVAEEDHPAPPHQPGLLPRWLGEKGVDLVIAGGMGRRAQDLFEQAGVKVLVGAPAGDPAQIVRSYLGDELETGDNICAH
jgi:predicted Fe-Mo cluster-binding NifX family protein